MPRAALLALMRRKFRATSTAGWLQLNACSSALIELLLS